jgi:hypothetical protein
MLIFFKKKELKVFQKKFGGGGTEFYEKMGQKITVDFFCCTNLCKRCAASSRFRTFRTNKRDLGRRRDDRILVAEEEIPLEIQERYFQQ